MATRKPSTSIRLASNSEEDPRIDVELLMSLMKDDSEQLHTLKLNNIKLDAWLLKEVFEYLKTAKNCKHLSLVGVGMKDEIGLELVEAFKENESLETVNIESNDLTNESLEPFFERLETHPNIHELKCSHQKAGLGSRGEEAMARALEKNPNLLKLGYSFKVPSARSLADRSQIRNNEIQRQRRTSGEYYYNMREETTKRDMCPQPWIKEEETPEEKNEKMIQNIGERKRSMQKVTGTEQSRRFQAQQRAKENAKPTMDNELANALGRARKASRSGAR